MTKDNYEDPRVIEAMENAIKNRVAFQLLEIVDDYEDGVIQSHDELIQAMIAKLTRCVNVINDLENDGSDLFRDFYDDEQAKLQGIDLDNCLRYLEGDTKDNPYKVNIEFRTKEFDETMKKAMKQYKKASQTVADAFTKFEIKK